MSNNTKKQSLLGKTPQKRKAPVKKPRNRPQTAPQPSTKPTTSTPAELPVKSKKWLLITLAVIFAVAIIFPKPTLLTYKKLGLVSESIYWPGVFGHGRTLLDSNLHPQLDEKRNALYLCADLKAPQSCQKYQLIKNNGFFAALTSYI
ncbi:MULTISPECIES: hypothetical protein [unclassified Pseudoalteromonas]|uniref:hypothetical protein n=1 Tax=unclassified Pseudoalteromonas TaxID=194690 RepID=UPI00235845BD|nr:MULTISPECIES: hypothetical protein [unclassified Pseudoalteromonas]MDC9530568.1 hypothetical protein [Pseudoalteromonas sp. Angola-7]BED89812.1 hypothetical protein PspMM1_22800 [Pseudoalteromonas sp. MM1]